MEVIDWRLLNVINLSDLLLIFLVLTSFMFVYLLAISWIEWIMQWVSSKILESIFSLRRTTKKSRSKNNLAYLLFVHTGLSSIESFFFLTEDRFLISGMTNTHTILFHLHHGGLFRSNSWSTDIHTETLC